MALTGRAALAALCGVVIVLLAPLGGRMVLIVLALLLIGIVADLVLAASPRAIAINRGGDTSTRVGDTATVFVAMQNSSSRTARGWVRDAWPPSAGASPRTHRIQLAPGDRRRVMTTLAPTRRGERRAAEVTLRLTGPLGLAARQRTRHSEWRVFVLPPFTSRRFLPEKLARLRQLDGAVVAPVRGQGTEFDSLREYVVGDDTRSIDWRATARRGDVVVRTWRPERDRQLLLVLDSGRTSAARVGGAPRFDAAIDAALLLTALARHAGDRVGVLVHDRRMRAAVDRAAGGAGLADVVRVVAPVEPQLVETDMSAVVAQILRRLRRRSLVVLFTALEPAALQEGLMPAIGPLLHRHVVVLASPSDPAVDQLRSERGDVDAVYRAAAAEAADSDRRRIATQLRRRGVVITEGPPDTFASHVADTYLGLKAAGRL
ncbi:MAG TPA: DUF58 domain-containing protein [Mycobacteriales bacterium]|nr:DUF58 domain-containing protein [Mycobacteriales bacterium]